MIVDDFDNFVGSKILVLEGSAGSFGFDVAPIKHYPVLFSELRDGMAVAISVLDLFGLSLLQLCTQELSEGL